MPAPENWYWVTGIAAGMFILVMIGTLALLAVLIRVLLDLQARIKSLTARIEKVSDRVEEVAIQAKDLTQSVGGRVKSIAGTVDDATQRIAQRVELASTVLLIATTAAKMIGRKPKRGKSR
ncbi:MAG TPA: hypothetical protein PLH94_06630 [Fimbriimonadaceae bacterium]|nr:hypothetical protein [Fimbriimonadaceae bacterium]